MFDVDIKMEMFMEESRWKQEIEHLISKGVRPLELSYFTTAEFRTKLAYDILKGEYLVAPPHVALIPKDKPGEFRKVYVNTVLDRLVLGIINSVYYDCYENLIHEKCVSYRKGIGVNTIIPKVCKEITREKATGYKVDISKYFDSVDRKTLDEMLLKISSGSAIDKIVWDYYHDNLIMNEYDQIEEHYKSLAQGCAVAAFLANLTLADVDDEISSLVPVYYRYSDDILIIGEKADEALMKLEQMLKVKGLKVNPKKVEKLSSDKWFTFLGCKIRGNAVSISEKSLKGLQKEIKDRTIKKIDCRHQASAAEAKKMVRDINKYLYTAFMKNPSNFGWAEYFFSIINCPQDIETIDTWIKDCIRSTMTKKRKIGGLGSIDTQATYSVARGKGRDVSGNLKKTADDFLNLGYVSMVHLYNAYHISKELYRGEIWRFMK